ncbi:hypothetical protein ON010_g16825 [Phytophthora cinnamomi]|nr:hypothetical protein ON010_g16825 [Phytophthora cinnamomi]
MVVVTTQHIENVETLDNRQNVQLQAQLKREDSEPWRSIEEREGAAKQKEMAHDARDVIVEGGQGSEGAAGEAGLASTGEGIATRMRTAKHVLVQAVNAVIAPDLKNYRESMRDTRADKWREAMRVEFEPLENNNAWEVVVRPRNSKLLHTNWVYKTKTHADGTVERCKGRLVT